MLIGVICTINDFVLISHIYLRLISHYRIYILIGKDIIQYEFSMIWQEDVACKIIFSRYRFDILIGGYS